MPSLTYQQRARYNEAWAMRRKFLLRAKQTAEVQMKQSAKWRMYYYALCYGVGWPRLCRMAKEKMYGD